MGIYFGYADCNGLESISREITSKNPKISKAFTKFLLGEKGYEEQNEKIYLKIYRAEANSRRHAVAFRVELDPDIASEIDNLLVSGNYVESLIKIKENAKSLWFFPGFSGKMDIPIRNWNMIPNPSLDPDNNLAL